MLSIIHPKIGATPHGRPDLILAHRLWDKRRLMDRCANQIQGGIIENPDHVHEVPVHGSGFDWIILHVIQAFPAIDPDDRQRINPVNT